jgi:hypothetical protein
MSDEITLEMVREDTTVVQQRRMYKEDVEKLRTRLDPRIDGDLSKLMIEFPLARHCFEHLRNIIKTCRWIESNPNLEPHKPFAYLFCGETKELLMSKLYELIEMMDKAGEEGVEPLSIGSIEKVGMSMVRRCFYIANKEVIDSVVGDLGEKYKYPVVMMQHNVQRIISDVFLHVYFNRCRDLLLDWFFEAVFSIASHCIKVKGNKCLVNFKYFVPFSEEIKERREELISEKLIVGIRKLRQTHIECAECKIKRDTAKAEMKAKAEEYAATRQESNVRTYVPK